MDDRETLRKKLRELIEKKAEIVGFIGGLKAELLEAKRASYQIASEIGATKTALRALPPAIEVQPEPKEKAEKK